MPSDEGGDSTSTSDRQVNPWGPISTDGIEAHAIGRQAMILI